MLAATGRSAPQRSAPLLYQRGSAKVRLRSESNGSCACSSSWCSTTVWMTPLIASVGTVIGRGALRNRMPTVLRPLANELFSLTALVISRVSHRFGTAFVLRSNWSPGILLLPDVRDALELSTAKPALRAQTCWEIPAEWFGRWHSGFGVCSHHFCIWQRLRKPPRSPRRATTSDLRETHLIWQRLSKSFPAWRTP